LQAADTTQARIEQMLQRDEEEHYDKSHKRHLGGEVNNTITGEDKDGDGIQKQNKMKEVQYYGNIVIDPNEKFHEEVLLQRLTEMVDYDNDVGQEEQLLLTEEGEREEGILDEDEVNGLISKQEKSKKKDALTSMPAEMSGDLLAYERMQMLVGRKATDNLASDPLLLNKKNKNSKVEMCFIKCKAKKS